MRLLFWGGTGIKKVPVETGTLNPLPFQPVFDLIQQSRYKVTYQGADHGKDDGSEDVLFVERVVNTGKSAGDDRNGKRRVISMLVVHDSLPV
jgi:hypothetical protein